MLTRIIIKASFSLIIILAATGYGSYLTTGQMPFGLEGMSLNKLTAPLQQQASSFSKQVEKKFSGAEENPSGIYKWQDEQGTWHYGDAPPDRKQATEMNIDLKQNVIDAVVSRDKPAAETEEKTEPESPLPSGSAYTPGTVKKLVNDAQGLQQKLDQRFEQQRKLLSQ